MKVIAHNCYTVFQVFSLPLIVLSQNKIQKWIWSPRMYISVACTSVGFDMNDQIIDQFKIWWKVHDQEFIYIQFGNYNFLIPEH